MKKVALSLFVVAASGAYVWSQWSGPATGDLLEPAAPQADGMATGSIAPSQSLPAPAPVPPIARRQDPLPHTLPPAPSTVAAEPPPLPPKDPPAPDPVLVAPEPPVTPVTPPAGLEARNIPLPRIRPSHSAPTPQVPVTPVAMKLAPVAAAPADSVYTGPAVDAYYGLVQVQAVVQGGQLTAIKILRYPSDRRTSVFINRQALPILRDEAIQAQSARVDIVSGATLTSKAFIRSLDGALRQAGA